MNVADTMNGSVITVTADKTIADAAELMLRHKISGLPVVDARGALIGIITEGDLLRRAETGTARRRAHWLELLTTPGRLAQDYAAAHARRVAEVMTTDVVTVLPEEPLENAVRLMEQRRIKRLPVIEDGRLVGIVSRADLVRALLRLLKAEPSQKPGDDEIRQSIMAEIDRQRWAPRAMLTVDVKEGIVDLSGCITDERERTALCVLVENIPGVVAVRDHLTWIDPVSGMVIGGDEEAR